jgi:hypothetical protein
MTQTQRIQTGDPTIAHESRTIFAHSLPGRPQSDWETLEVHAARVAELARSFASAFGAADWGNLLGRWHDLGKRSDKFQEFIRTSAMPALRGTKLDIASMRIGQINPCTGGKFAE